MSEEKETTNSFSRFGSEFQQKLCFVCLNDREFADQFSEVLDYNYFELKYLQIVLKNIYEYREKYKMHPTFDAIHIVLSELALKNETNKSYKQAVDYIDQFKNQTAIKDEKFVRDTALEFCKKQVLKKALMQSVDLLAKSSFDEIKTVIDDAMKKGVTRDLGHDYIRDCESRFDTKARLVIPTPWPEINDLTGGGFGRGDLHIMVAPTGMGKSHLMVDFGAFALQNGYKGVHYTLELSASKTGWRYDANISEIDVNLRREAKEQIKSVVRKLTANLIIREWPTKSASVMTIRSHLDKLSQNDFKPDFVIVDYADLLKPVSKHTEKRNQLEEIIEELRAIASEYNVAVITASQTNRTSYNAEFISLDSIAEAYSKCFPADFIMTLSRTQKEREQGLGKFFVAKNRNGSDGIVFKVRVDTALSHFEILQTADDATTDSATNQQTSWKDKFANGRKH